MISSIIYTSIKHSFLLVDLVLVIIMIKVYLDLKKTNSNKNNPILNILVILFAITTFLAINQMEDIGTTESGYTKEELMEEEKLKMEEINRIKNNKK